MFKSTKDNWAFAVRKSDLVSHFIYIIRFYPTYFGPKFCYCTVFCLLFLSLVSTNRWLNQVLWNSCIHLAVKVSRLLYWPETINQWWTVASPNCLGKVLEGIQFLRTRNQRGKLKLFLSLSSIWNAFSVILEKLFT